MINKTLSSLIAMMVTCYASTIVAAPPWNHDEQDHWGAIEDSSQTVIPLNYPFAECSIGAHQSPVDFAEAKIDNTRKLNNLEIWYDVDSKPVFFNTGHAIQVNTSSGYKGELKIGEESFPLVQFHFHEPSEHAVGGEKFPAELHFVHVGQDGRLIVLGVAINLGAENATMQTILNNMPTTEGGQNPDTGIAIDPTTLLPSLRHQKFDYVSLAGSLTTPPCSEGVQWYLMLDPITISAAQLDQMKGFYSNNVRKTQNLNGRTVSSTK
ncbi:carbonic anhydrase [Nitrosomonas sp.]|uniref:carbonic anhydrase n=1 Tax=Nitrosomonas sp. TaxID=42353 RepID=UPI001D7EEA87|nr:carbonic anhydrase family protein [Nitrosomonas sp.]MBX3616087.1 carbonic anhydrase family protein [Nitrosomonas sp.]